MTRRFPLTLKPMNEMAFSGASYKATGNSSSYPSVLNIGLNDPFAVHSQDPNADLFFANPDDVDKGIYGPRRKGLRDLWSDADLELQPRVQAAREALERIESGR